MKITLLKPKLSFCIAFLLFFSIINISLAQTTFNWVGGADTNFYNVNNWDNTSIDFANAGSSTLIIGSANPNNPVQTGGYNGSSTSYRPNYFNTTENANFTISGNLIPWNSSYLNGLITDRKSVV